MSEEKEVIGLLPVEDAGDRARERAQALVRHADGRMAVEDLGAEARKGSGSLVRFRLGRPILDPVTREVMGYEMEQVSLAASA